MGQKQNKIKIIIEDTGGGAVDVSLECDQPMQPQTPETPAEKMTVAAINYLTSLGKIESAEVDGKVVKL